MPTDDAPNRAIWSWSFQGSAPLWAGGWQTEFARVDIAEILQHTQSLPTPNRPWKPLHGLTPSSAARPAESDLRFDRNPLRRAESATPPG